jgi:uncharacterized protein
MAYLLITRGVLDALSDSRVVSDTLDLTEVRLGEDVFTPLTPATFSLTLSNTGAGIVASGTARATFRTRCVRCLCEYDADVHAEVEGFYVEAGDDADLPEEQEREFITDERIDLEPAVVQSLVLTLPFAPLHSPDCAGLCASCGADLNDGPCACAPQTGGSQFAVLKELLTDAGDV